MIFVTIVSCVRWCVCVFDLIYSGNLFCYNLKMFLKKNLNESKPFNKSKGLGGNSDFFFLL